MPIFEGLNSFGRRLHHSFRACCVNDDLAPGEQIGELRATKGARGAGRDEQRHFSS
jgi:hypothetical protein